ncbi:MAG: hypothetical protein AAB516_02210 [Patescibacteria group bacterium]
MDKDLLKNLNKLREIKPNKDYSKQSRLLILSSPRNYELKTFKIGFLDSFMAGFRKPATVLAISGVFILIIVFGFSYINQILSPLFLPGLNKNNLVAEADEMTVSIQVRLDDVKYNIQELQNKKLADLATLNKLKVLLVEATSRLEEASELSVEADKIELSLQKMKAAKEILQEMNLEINGVLNK